MQIDFYSLLILGNGNWVGIELLGASLSVLWFRSPSPHVFILPSNECLFFYDNYCDTHAPCCPWGTVILDSNVTTHRSTHYLPHYNLMLVSFPQRSYYQVKLLTCQLLSNDGGCFIGVQGSSVFLQIWLFSKTKWNYWPLHKFWLPNCVRLRR